MEATNKDIDATFDVEDLTLQFSQLEMILISIHPSVTYVHIHEIQLPGFLSLPIFISSRLAKCVFIEKKIDFFSPFRTQKNLISYNINDNIFAFVDSWVTHTYLWQTKKENYLYKNNWYSKIWKDPVNINPFRHNTDQLSVPNCRKIFGIHCGSIFMSLFNSISAYKLPKTTLICNFYRLFTFCINRLEKTKM